MEPSPSPTLLTGRQKAEGNLSPSLLTVRKPKLKELQPPSRDTHSRKVTDRIHIWVFVLQVEALPGNTMGRGLSWPSQCAQLCWSQLLWEHHGQSPGISDLIWFWWESLYHENQQTAFVLFGELFVKHLQVQDYQVVWEIDGSAGKVLVMQPEGLSSIPRTCIKMSGIVARACPPVLGRQTHGFLGITSHSA